MMIGLLIPALILLHLFISPYTKVEESFNMQATHDILQSGVPWSNTSAKLEAHFDHVKFPGAVPRTFVGSLLLAGVSKPFVSLLARPDQVQLLIRAILGLANAGTLLHLRSGVEAAYGRIAGRWYILFLASQFHVLYYASRTLPNMFALMLTTLATRNLILVKSAATNAQRGAKHARVALYLLTISGIVFRSEIAILLAAETAYLLYQQKASFTKDVLPSGILGATVGLLATVCIDSFFWQQFPIWPEWIGFYYNAILGKSSDWGVSPFHYYVSNALPRLLQNPAAYLICIPISMILPISGAILLPQVAFIAVYSLMPHKEWRFIIYTIPAFTAVAAGGAGWIWTRRAKTILYRVGSLVLVVSTLASFAASIVSLYVSSLNYPGGDALRRLHEIVSRDHQKAEIQVYMDNLACQTGITRFQQIQPLWTYDKTEDEETLLTPTFWRQFDYVLAEKPERVIGSWQPIETIHAFAGITLRPGDEDEILPIPSAFGSFGKRLQGQYYNTALQIRQEFTRGYWPAIKMKPRIYILEKEPPLAAPHRPLSQT